MPNLPIFIPGRSTRVEHIQPNFQLKAIARPLSAMIFQPRHCWETLKNDGRTFRSVFEEQVFVLALIPSLCGFIGYSVVGEGDIVAGFTRAVFGYVGSIAFIYCAALFAHKTAEAFSGEDSIDVSGKLVIYSLMPFYVASVFLVHPTIAPLVLFGAFGAYEFFQGARHMTDVPKERIQIYTCINLVAWIFVLDRLLNALFT